MNKFKAWCVENRYTARSIAEKTGISIQTVYSYMEGRRNPSRKNQKVLEDTYKVDMRELFPL